MSSITAYLDTCIVSGLAKKDLGSDELAALRLILQAWEKGNVSLVTSSVVQEEIEKIPKEHRIKHETIYNLLSQVPVARAFSTTPGRLLLLKVGGGSVRRPNPIFAELHSLLPDEADAHHLYQAARNEVQYFLTTDARTILSYQSQIEDICGVKVMSPQNFLAVLD